MNSHTTEPPILWAWLVFALLLGALAAIFGSFFPLPGGNMGHDYALVLTGWLDGHIWFAKNGLAAPWFTPSFCAGQPFFADPQSAYYAYPQWLAIAFGPVQAAYLTLCISATLMFWGGYLLMRHVFASGMTAAVLVGGLLMFNGFLPHRLIIGHLGFHGFALVPWIALCLLVPVRTRIHALGVALLAGCALAYWVHGGFGTLILPAALGVLLIALLYGLRGGALGAFFGRSLLAALLGLALSASKLVAAFALLANFPRTFYALPGAASVQDAIVMLMGALWLPSQSAGESGSALLTGVQFGLAPHEWAYNFSFGSLALGLLLLFLAARLLRQGGTGSGPLLATWRPGIRQATLLAVLLLVLAWPVAFNVAQPEWTAFLKTVPIINTASTPLRWLIIYIPVLAIALGLGLHLVPGTRRQAALVAACLLATVAQTALEPREYYAQQNYDAGPVVIAEQLLNSGQYTSQITQLGSETKMRLGSSSIPLRGNNTMVAGVSQAFCYNPIFGYRLEKYSADNLVPGPVLDVRNGSLNLKNPACYVFPQENNCRPGDLFRADQLAEAQNFVNYRPFAFERSARQLAADRVSQIALGGCLAIGMLILSVLLWQRLARRRANQG